MKLFHKYPSINYITSYYKIDKVDFIDFCIKYNYICNEFGNNLIPKEWLTDYPYHYESYVDDYNKPVYEIVNHYKFDKRIKNIKWFFNRIKMFFIKLFFPVKITHGHIDFLDRISTHYKFDYDDFVDFCKKQNYNLELIGISLVIKLYPNPSINEILSHYKFYRKIKIPY